MNKIVLFKEFSFELRYRGRTFFVPKRKASLKCASMFYTNDPSHTFAAHGTWKEHMIYVGTYRYIIYIYDLFIYVCHPKTWFSNVFSRRDFVQLCPHFSTVDDCLNSNSTLCSRMQQGDDLVVNLTTSNWYMYIYIYIYLDIYIYLYFIYREISNII